MNFKREHLKDLVEFCGGDSRKVKGWISNIINKEINSLDELKNYPIKNNYEFLVNRNKYPNFRNFIDYYDHFNRKEWISLETVIDLLEQDYELNECYKNKIIEELIDLKFGGMCFDW